MAKPIPTMPNELLDHILSFSSQYALWETRQVSREFHAISITHMFRCTYLDANTKKLERFHKLLTSKPWADSVRELVVIGPQVRPPASGSLTSCFVILKFRSQIPI